MKKILRSRRGFVQIIAVMVGVVVIGAMVQGSQLLSLRQQKKLAVDLAELEGYYSAEMAAIRSFTTAPPLGEVAPHTIASFSNSYTANRGIGYRGPAGQQVSSLRETAAADTSENYAMRLNGLSGFVREMATSRMFCGAADLSYKTVNQGSMIQGSQNTAEVCLTKNLCTAGAPAACYDQAPVRELYRAILGREPSAAEAQFYIDQIVAGTTTIQTIASTFRSSAEYLAHVPTSCGYTLAQRQAAGDYVESVIALYRTFYGRLPDWTLGEARPHIEALMRCPFEDNGAAGLALALDSVLNNFKTSLEFTGAPNNSTLHAEAVREFYLRLYGRDPVVNGNGFGPTPGPMAAWMGLLTGEIALRDFSNGPRFAINTIDPAFTREYATTAPFGLVNSANLLAPQPWAGALGGVLTPGAMLVSEIESNPVPRAATVDGMTDANAIDPGDGYTAAGSSAGEVITGIFRTMLGRAPTGPYPRDEADYYNELMNTPYNAPNSYIAQMLQASDEFAARGGGCGCTAVPAPQCKFAAPKTSIAPGETITISLHVYANHQLDASGNVLVGRPSAAWNGVTPRGSITSVYWGANQTVYRGYSTYTANRIGGAAGTRIRETATVSGPGGSSTCSIEIDVPPTILSCNIHQMKRGPGSNSVWQFGRPRGDNNDGNAPYSIGGTGGRTQDFYNWWQVFIPARPAAEFQFNSSFRYGSGYWYVGATPPVFSGNYDPCNRGPCSVAVGLATATPMPATFVHLGQTYRLMTRPSDGTPQTYVNGGICGSADCLCYLGGVVSPLVVDFAGVGFDVQPGVHFDMGQGKKNHFWPKHANEVAFLVLDRNADSKINNFNELFGSPTIGPKGKRAKNGFEALRHYDENGDRSIDKYDPIFTKLRLWFDRNRNGLSEPGELATLPEMHVAKIDLYYSDVSVHVDNYGNEIRQRSVVTMTDGTHRRIVDIWLAEGNPNDKSQARVSSNP